MSTTSTPHLIHHPAPGTAVLVYFPDIAETGEDFCTIIGVVASVDPGSIDVVVVSERDCDGHTSRQRDGDTVTIYDQEQDEGVAVVTPAP